MNYLTAPLMDGPSVQPDNALTGGQARRAWVNALADRVGEYIPPELRGGVNVLSMLNPVNDVGEAMQNSRVMMDASRSGRERFDAGVDMATNMAAVLAPVVAGKMAGGADEAADVVDALLGFGGPTREAATDYAKRFAADESGAVDLPVDFNAFKKSRAKDDFAKKIKSVVDDVASGGYQSRLDAEAFELHKSGNLPLPVGTKVLPPPTYEMGSNLRVSGYWVDPQDARVFGYKLKNDAGKEFNEFVNNPKLGLTPMSADKFGGGFRAFAGPDADARLGFSRPENPRPVDLPKERVSPSVEKEYKELFGSTDPATQRGQEVLDLLRNGRAGEVTDEMLDLGDPTLNARLNEYLFNNYDLPMDEASRMARAREMGFDTDTPLYHGTESAFEAFDEAYQRDPGFWFTTNQRTAANYAEEDGALHNVFTAPQDVSTVGMEYGDDGLQAFINGSPSEITDNVELLREAQRGRSGTVEFPAGNFTEDDFTRVEFDPTKIRRTTARFDPRLSHLRNLSAGAAGLGILGGAMTPADEVDAWLNGEGM